MYLELIEIFAETGLQSDSGLFKSYLQRAEAHLNNSEINCLFFFSQALTDQQQFGKADEMYDKCIELEPDNATTYVHKG